MIIQTFHVIPAPSHGESLLCPSFRDTVWNKLIWGGGGVVCWNKKKNTRTHPKNRTAKVSLVNTFSVARTRSFFSSLLPRFKVLLFSLLLSSCSADVSSFVVYFLGVAAHNGFITKYTPLKQQSQARSLQGLLFQAINIFLLDSVIMKSRMDSLNSSTLTAEREKTVYTKALHVQHNICIWHCFKLFSAFFINNMDADFFFMHNSQAHTHLD